MTSPTFAALRDDIEALLIGHAWLRGPDGETLAEVREWLLGDALRAQLRVIAERCPPSDALTRHALDLEARAPRTATASGAEAATRPHAILADDEQDVAAFVSRVTGTPVAASGPAFAALVARIDDVVASERLHAARRAIVERRCAALADAVEATVAVRRRTVDEVAPDPAIDAFLDELLDIACDDAVALERELRAAVPEARRPLDHVGRVARRLRAAADGPTRPRGDARRAVSISRRRGQARRAATSGVVAELVNEEPSGIRCHDTTCLVGLTDEREGQVDGVERFVDGHVPLEVHAHRSGHLRVAGHVAATAGGAVGDIEPFAQLRATVRWWG